MGRREGLAETTFHASKSKLINRAICVVRSCSRDHLQPSLSTSLFPQVVAEQVFDNAMVAAGLLDDSRVMLPRLNQLIERLVKAGK